MSTDEPITEPAPEITAKTARLKKIKSTAIVVGFYGTCAAVTAGSMFYGYKVTAMQLEAAKMNLAAATLNAAEQVN